MKVKLQVQQKDRPVRTLTLQKSEAVIGRSRGNAVRIPHSDVSRKHCRLCLRDERVTVEDLDSLNGTYLNNQRIEGIREVHSGDQIRVGPVTFRVDFVTTDKPEMLQPEEPEKDRIDPDQIAVLAVYHSKRDPRGWQRRV